MERSEMEFEREVARILGSKVGMVISPALLQGIDDEIAAATGLASVTTGHSDGTVRSVVTLPDGSTMEATLGGK